MRTFKLLSTVIAFIAALLLSASIAFADSENIKIDESMTSKGLLKVSYTSSSENKNKIMIEKDNNRAFFNINNEGIAESFPLQNGSGDYKVSILENTTANKYRSIYSKVVYAQVPTDNTKYLNSIQNIKWDDKSNAIIKAKSLVNAKMTDTEKLKVLYNYVISNVKYDFSLIGKLPSGYIPNIDSTLKTKKGICYDFSSLFAAMLRSQNIPAKLVMGNTSNVNGYHAWNEVFINDRKGSGRWITIDTSYDSQMKEAKRKYTMEKNKSIYIKTSEF